MEYQIFGNISQGYTSFLSKDLKSKDHVLPGQDTPSSGVSLPMTW